MAEIEIATSGYSYDDWKGILYPEDLPKSGYLQYYSLFFPFVELNFSYYAMPKPQALSNMLAKTPKGFLFSIKAHRSLSHEPGPGWKEDAKTYSRAVNVLAAADRLLAVLIQLPYRFHYTKDNRTYLAALLKELAPLPLLLEFRNNEWNSQRVYEELERRNTGLVMTDNPDLPGLPMPGLPMFGSPVFGAMANDTQVIGNIAYIRYHGRNTESWWSGNAVSRYDYLYSEEELALTIPRLKSMTKKAKLYVAFNNHARGSAVKNARQLKKLLVGN